MTDRAADGVAAPIRRISLIVPMYNEEDHVADLVRDVAAQDFRGEMEMIVADGGSTDRSIERLRAAADEARIELAVVSNPARWVSHGLNECIRRSRGDLIVRLDCHTRYPADYVSTSVAAAEATGAWCVGGIMDPVGRTTTERAVAAAMWSPFGGISWSRYNAQAGRFDSDTVYLGAFRPEAFDAVGMYDTTLVRDQDDELTLRLRLAGGRVVLDPSIRAWYRPRGSYRAVMRQYYEYGLWKVPVMLKHRRAMTARSLAPALFVSSLTGLAAGALASTRARRLLAAESAAYLGAAVAFAVRAVRQRGDEVRLVPRVVLVFPAFHLAYGGGFVRGGMRAATAALRARTRPGHAEEARDSLRLPLESRGGDGGEAG